MHIHINLTLNNVGSLEISNKITFIHTYIYIFIKVESNKIGTVSNNCRVNIKMRTRLQETQFTDHQVP